MPSALIVGTGVWSCVEPLSVHLAELFLKNNHCVSSEEVPELIINKQWMLWGDVGPAAVNAQSWSRGVVEGGASVPLECSG